MKCLNCGFECPDGGAFCNNCGSKLTAPVQPQQAPQQPQQVPQQAPQQVPQQVPQQPQQQVPQQPQQQAPVAEKKKVNLPVLIILLVVGLLIIGGGAYAILDGFDIIDEPDLFSFVGGEKDDEDEDDEEDKDDDDGSTKDADENEEVATAGDGTEKPKPLETTAAAEETVAETTTRYERETEAVATEAVETDAVSLPDSGAYDDYDWEADVDRYLSLSWEMAEIIYEYMDVEDFEDLPEDVQERYNEIEYEMLELEDRIDTFMGECDDDTYNEIMEMIADEMTDIEETYPELFY